MYWLFDFSSSLRPEPVSAELLFGMIENSINATIIQHERIVHDDLFYRFSRTSKDRSNWNTTMLFSDIHFYLIEWSRVKKLYEKLVEVQPFYELEDSHLDELKEHNRFRNHLEHIEDRIEKGIGDLGNLFKNKFSFAGKTIDISITDLAQLKHIYWELLKITVNKFQNPFMDYAELYGSLHPLMHELKEYLGVEIDFFKDIPSKPTRH